MGRVLGVALCALVAAVHAGAVAGPGGDIPKLNLEPSATVSGISSGGFMATQMHVAYSVRGDVRVCEALAWRFHAGNVSARRLPCA